MRGGKTRYYENLNKEKVDAILNELRNNNVTVTGNNPWDADINTSGIKLRGEYTERDMMLAVTITDRDWYVSYSMIWKRIDSLVHHIQGLSDLEFAALTRPPSPKKRK